VCYVAVAAQTTGPPPFPTAQVREAKVDSTPPSLFPARTVWTLPLNNLLAFAPTYDGTRGYFPLAGNRIVAYDVLAGTQTWIAAARPIMQPVAGGDLLFVIEADSVAAFRGGEGTVTWRRPLNERLVVPPVWDNGWLVLATEGGVRAIRATDGDVIWSRDLDRPATAAPALAADRVYVPIADGRILALRIDTGEPVWERKLGGSAVAVLALDDRVYVGGHNDYFYCLLAKDGRVDWRWRTGGDVIGTPILDDDRICFVAMDNVLRALDRKSGVQKWMRPLPLRPTAAPVRVGSSIIVTGFAPSLRGYRSTDGTAAADITANSEVAAPPYVVPNPKEPLPGLLYVTRDIASGATLTLVTRSFEPVLTPIGTLPNPLNMTPTTGATTPKP
jgi:outer membrane protein assembly factor BamB